MPDTQKLVEIVTQTPEAEPLFTYLSKRERHRGDTDISRLLNYLNKHGVPLNRTTVEQVFDSIQAAGFGHVVGTSTKKKFKWDVNVVKVGRIVKSSLEGHLARPMNIERRVATESPIIITVGTASVQVAALSDAAALLKLINAVESK